MENFTSPTDFSLKSITIAPNNDKEPVEISKLVNEFQYGENIESPFLSGMMEVVDSGGLLQSLPIQGGEKVKIKVRTTFSEELYEYELIVWTVANRYARQNKQVYTLGLISEEALINEITRVQKPLSGNPENIVKDLLTNSIKTKKTVFSESSKFEVKLISARRRPFDILTSITRNSVSPLADSQVSSSKKDSNATQKSEGETTQTVKGTGGFFFWETRRGYNFFAVDSLCADENSKLKSKKLESESWGPYIEKVGNQDDGGDTRSAIYESYFGSQIDMLQSLRRGKYSSLVVFFNHSTGQYEEYVYKIKDSYDNMAHLGGQDSLSLVPVNEIELSEYPSRIMSILLDHETWYNSPEIASPEPRDGSSSPTKFADWQKYYATQSIARYELLKNQICTIVIPGNPDICAGDKIDIRLVSKSPESERKSDPYDPESSGVYLISQVTHSYNTTVGSTGRFITTLILLRDSYGLKDRPSGHGAK